MFVHRFPGRIAEGAGVGVHDGADLDGTHFFEGLGCEFVFFVEIRGDHEQAVLVESLKGLVENLGPNRFVVPEVLMAEEGDIRSADFLEVAEAIAAMDDEVGGGSFFEFLFPARVRLSDFRSADIETLNVGGFGLLGENFGQNTRFVSPTTSEIKEVEMIFFYEVRVEKIAQIPFQRREIPLKQFMEGGVGHGETLK